LLGGKQDNGQKEASLLQPSSVDVVPPSDILPNPEKPENVLENVNSIG
jgi:hypothetical protein